MENESLHVLFDKNKEKLEESLAGLSLPRDAEEVQTALEAFLSTLLANEGEYRLTLTQAEDYLLQATLSLLTAQQEMSKAVFCHEPHTKTIQESSKEETIEEGLMNDSHSKSVQDFFRINVPASEAVLGTAIGTLSGKLILGGWGAVFGAIAGTAVVVYLANRSSVKKPIDLKNHTSPKRKAEIIAEPIDIQMFINIVARICDNVDNLVATFRAQVNRVADKYESMEKPTIEKEYRFLLESIQSLIGYKRTHTLEDGKSVKKIQERIEDLVDCLENYNLETVDYNGQNDFLFEMISSPETDEKRMVYPAIVKNDIPVLKGKVFVPTTESN